MGLQLWSRHDLDTLVLSLAHAAEATENTIAGGTAWTRVFPANRKAFPANRMCVSYRSARPGDVGAKSMIVCPPSRRLSPAVPSPCSVSYSLLHTRTPWRGALHVSQACLEDFHAADTFVAHKGIWDSLTWLSIRFVQQICFFWRVMGDLPASCSIDVFTGSLEVPSKAKGVFAWLRKLDLQSLTDAHSRLHIIF